MIRLLSFSRMNGFAIAFLLSVFQIQAQTLDLIELAITTDSITTTDYIISGKLRNNGTGTFQGDVTLKITVNHGTSNLDGIQKNNSIDYPLGTQNILENESKNFQIRRNISKDNFNPSRNIICVWPKVDKDKPGFQRNIICVWPKTIDKNAPVKGASRLSNPSDNDTDNNTKDDLSYRIYPNPLVGITYLLINSQQDRTIKINVVNNIGQLMKTITTTVATGQQFVEIDLNDLGNGVYFFEVMDENKSGKLQKLIKQD